MEECGNNRGGGVSGSYTHAGGNPPKISVASFVGFLKGKSSLLIYQKWANMKYKYRNREFWCRGYYVDTVGKNTTKIKEYIANQLKEDKLTEQMTITELLDPFKQ